MADWNADDLGAAPPDGGPQPSMAEVQRRAAAAQAPVGDLGPAPPPPPAPQGFLSRAFHTIVGLPADVASWATTPINTDLGVEHGIARGVRDVIDTGAHALSSITPGADTDALRARDKAERDAWEAQYGQSTAAALGRLGGQYIATAGPIGMAGRTLAAGAGMISPAVAAAARFLTGATPAAGFLPRVGQLAVTGAGTGAAQAALTSGGYDQPAGEQIGTGAATGAVLGPVIGGATKLFDASRGYIGGVRPEVADLANVARQYGVTPPVTAMTTNPFLRQVSDALQKLPFSGADAAALAKQRQFQAALTREMGSTADTLGPATMQETANRLNRGYNNLYASAPPITGGAPLTSDVANVGADAARFLVGDQAGAMAHVGNAMQEVGAAFSHGGTLDPRAYKSLMGANDGTLARIEDAAPSAAQPYLRRIRDAVQARFAASAGPDAAQELQDLDRQWRAMKTVQPLAATSTLGDIGPGGLMQKVVNVSNEFDGSTGGVAYTGGGPLGDLGRVGKQFFGHIPDSGTAGRLQAYDLAKNPFGTLAMLPFGVGLGRPAQMWANSPRIAGRVIDTARGQPIPDITRAIPAGLLGVLDRERGQTP